MNDIIVFSGSTLSKKEIKHLLPEATIMPPIQCGDCLKAVRLKPKVIIMIDGIFESAASVWHKEILYALELGIHVIGASCIGALRAAELMSHGMIGIGKIYDAYAEGSLEDDDEVALLHTHDYFPLSTPMINIRYTLQTLRKKNILTKKEEADILLEAKKRHYTKRDISDILVSLGLSHLQPFFETHYVNQKKEDAMEALRYTKQLKDPYNTSIITPKTLYFRTLLKKTACSIENTQDPHTSLLLQQLANLLGSIYDVVHSNDIPAEGELRTWVNLLTCTPDENAFLTYFFKQCEYFINKYKETSSYTALQEDLFFWTKCFGLYPKLIKRLGKKNVTHDAIIETFQRYFPQQYRICVCIVRLWSALYSMIVKEQGLPSTHQIQHTSDTFRMKQGLHSKIATKTWLEQNNCSETDYQRYMTELTLWNYLIVKNNLAHSSRHSDNRPHPWICYAKRYAGL